MIRRYIMDLFFPRHCVFCNEMIPWGEKTVVCEKCQKTASRITGKVCVSCGYPLADNYLPGVCPRCRQRPPHYAQHISVFRYRDSVRHGIHLMKFVSWGEMNARAMGQMMVPLIAKGYQDIDFDLMLPIPLSYRRHRERRFNQAEILAEEISYVLGIPVDVTVLKKIKDTPKQSLQKLEDRYKNVEGAYAVVKPERVEGKRILLIDDVLTTGATCSEIAKILKRAGAESVYCATFAMVTRQ